MMIVNQGKEEEEAASTFNHKISEVVQYVFAIVSKWNSEQ